MTREVEKHYLYNVELIKALRDETTRKYRYFVYSSHDVGGGNEMVILSDRKIPTGQTRQYLQRTTFNELNAEARELLGKKMGCKVTYIRSPPLDLSPMTNKECKRVVWNYLKRDGAIEYSVDEDLLKLFAMDFFVTGIEGEDVMKYCPHKIIYSNTKTGKSSLAMKMGKVASESSVARLLGFSTAKDVVDGALDGLKVPFYADEINESRNIMSGNLLNLMELGHSCIEKGKSSITTEFTNSLNWLSNPDLTGKSNDRGKLVSDNFFVLNLINCLSELSNSVQGFCSRLGVFLFSTDLDTVEVEDTVAPSVTERNEKVFLTLRELSEEPFVDFLCNDVVRQWLESPHRDSYRDAIGNLRVGEPILKKMRNGLKENHKHCKGGALRLALLNHLGDLIWDEVDVDDVLDEASGYVDWLNSLVTKSLRDMMEVVDIEKLYVDWLMDENKETRSVILSILMGDGASHLKGLDLVYRYPSHLLDRVDWGSLKKYGVHCVVDEGENDVVLRYCLEDVRDLFGDSWKGVAVDEFGVDLGEWESEREGVDEVDV